MNTNEIMPVFLFLSVSGVAMFSFVSIAVWSDARRKEREAFYRSEMIKKIAESQGGDAALEFLREEERQAARRNRAGQTIGGLITMMVGIGLMVFLKGIVHGDQGPVFLVGVIPLLVGAVMFSYAKFLAPKE